jgi:hypothetical protein
MHPSFSRRARTRASIGLLARASLILCGGTLLGTECSATDHTWVAQTDNWNNGLHWNPLSVPGNGDNAILPQNSNTSYTVTFDGNYSNGNVLSDLKMSGYFSVGVEHDTTLNQTGANHDMYTTREYIGYDGRGVAIYNQSKSTNNTYDLEVGWDSAASGAYNLSGDGYLLANYELIGVGSSGTFTQTGGINSSGYVTIGSLSGTGVYMLQGGALTSLSVYARAGGTFNHSGGTFLGIINVEGGTYDLSGTGAFDGTYPNQLNITSGVFSQTGGSLGSTTVTQSGGTIDGTLVNTGSFIYSGGTFNGKLQNQGAVTFNADFFAFGGIENNTTMMIAAGRTVFGGHGFANYGIVNLNGGMLEVSGVNNVDSFVNDGVLSGNGTIYALIPFVNSATITQNGGNLILQTYTGVSDQNLGAISLAAGYVTQLAGSMNFLNNGVVNLNGSTITGTGAFVNGIGGSLIGTGTITSAFSNSSGYIDVTGGALIVSQTFNNTGTIHLSGAGSSLLGGTIANTGSIEGTGNVGNAVTNSSGGTIEAIGGTLNLGGSLTNSAGGLIAASGGNKILVTQGLATNAGTINLTGGTFDNNGHALNNIGEISGYGIFRSLKLTNNGKITFTGGTTTINGDVTNQTGHSIAVAHDPAIFTGNVINNGTFKTTASTVTFAASYTENGTFISDPATQNFQDLTISSTGALVGGEGDVFSIAGNLLNKSTQREAWDTRYAEIKLIGGHTHTLAWSGADLGADMSGFDNNFAIGTLLVASGDSLTLEDGDANPGAAIYVTTLDFAGGLAQIASVVGNGVNIDYDPSQPGNAYLQGATYSLQGGGVIQAVPEPGSIVLLSMALALAFARGRKGRSEFVAR